MLAYDVIVAGDYCLDLIFSGLKKLPELGVEIVSTGFEMLPGGTYNTAVCLHRLGIQVGWAGDFGSDEFSQLVIQKARQEGLDTQLFITHNRPLRNITVAASYPQERAFIAYYDPAPELPAAIKALTRASARFLYMPGIYYGPGLDAGLILVRGKRMKLIMDGNSTEETFLSNPAVKRAIRSTEIFMPNVLEARRITQEDDLDCAMQVLGELVPLVVVKDGSNGSYAVSHGTVIHEPGIRVDPVDTTGAGDAYNAGFIKAWHLGLPLRECLRWGNIVGGLSTLAHGGTGKLITEDVVRMYL